MHKSIAVRVTFILALALISAAAGYTLHLWLNARSSSAATPAVAGVAQQRPDFTLPDLHGKPRNISAWDGKVLLVNFWATWCPPCRKEIPDLMKLQHAYGKRGLQVIGVAIDDKQKIRDYADTMGIDYPILFGSQDAIEVATRYGDYFGAIPYSVIINRQGRIVFTHRGELSPKLAEQTIKPLL